MQISRGIRLADDRELELFRVEGNVGYAGPFNMYIDPDSDLPVTSIAFPAAGADVAGNVDIIGTCYDDDAVAKVSLRVDDAEQIYTAKGTEFWSSIFFSPAIRL